MSWICLFVHFALSVPLRHLLYHQGNFSGLTTVSSCWWMWTHVFVISSMGSVPVITFKTTLNATRNNACLCTLTNISLYFVVLTTSTQIGTPYNNILWITFHSACLLPLLGPLILGISLTKLVSLISAFLFTNSMKRLFFCLSSKTMPNSLIILNLVRKTTS